MTFMDVLNTATIMALCYVCWRVQRHLMRPSNVDAQIIEDARWNVHNAFADVGQAMNDAMPFGPRIEEKLAREVSAGSLSPEQADIIRNLRLTQSELTELGRRVHFGPRKGSAS